MHKGECMMDRDGCYKCGKTGHMAWDYQGPRSCYLCGSPDHIKTDCPQLKKGATGGADDSRVLVGEVNEGCRIDIDGHSFLLRLYPMGMGEFDVVVGMYWLASNDANIVCNKKLIRISLPSKEEVVVYGDRRDKKSCLISMIKARQCLAKGCVGFLAYVLDVKKEKKGLESVPVVCEYPEVFPEDLTTLPPDRHVEFRIDLMPGVAPITREPYRLAPTEMKKMMTQLQELLDKGFIHPSTSP
ncbi:hypothetical protein L6452_40633 [Arctium lappa]|uniref:Uncharacterized protein n=1 Tax=Arctium lappa TaxID=4217 RepID=A0ACB8XLW8_ARCLA|nr:hypothetical protein L6452_40633 [Arctium lappa]